VTAPACDGVAAVLRPGVGRLVDEVLGLSGDGSLVAVVVEDVTVGGCERVGCGWPALACISMADPLTGGQIVALRCRRHAVAWVRWLLQDPHRSTQRIHVEVVAG
jgi:hypothetical protein